MKERINWIDWAKALAVCSVVFCHLPQSQEWFYYRYLQALTMVVFIFISGYLKKDRGSDKENWKKYWYGLIVPYIIYNVVVYPYWILKYYLVHGGMPDMFQAMRPLIGALLMEHESSFAEPLNGPLWYLPAILFMHVLIDLCRKTRYQHWIMTGLCILSIILYGANKYWEFTPQLTPIGIMRNLPYYYMGYLFGQYHLFRECNLRWDIIGCITCLLASILLFSWHLEAFYAGQHILHIALFYPINVLFLFGVLYGCKVLNGLRHSIVTNISIGTLVIIGLHIMLVTIANFSLEHTLGINGTICYQWYTALPTAIVIVALLYPIILWSKRFFPILLGKNTYIFARFREKHYFCIQNRTIMKENLGLLLSIIVPVYNVENYIRPCIESIFRQDLDEDTFEVIIVNDGTEDRSIEVIHDIIEQHKNIIVLNQENQGLSVARNNGIAKAKGEYILMPDSDDLLIENSLKPLLEKAIETKVDLVVADFISLKDQEIKEMHLHFPKQPTPVYVKKTGEQLFLGILNPYHCHVWRTLYRREFLNAHNLSFYPGIKYQDIPFTHECYLKANRCIRTNIILNIYRRWPGSSINAYKKDNTKDFIIAINETWKLRQIKGLSPKILHKLEEDVYTSFCTMIYHTLHSTKQKENRNEIMDYLNTYAPDLNFVHDFRQRLTTMMIKRMPHLFINLYYLYAKIAYKVKH